MAEREPKQTPSRRGRLKITISMNADTLDRLDRLADLMCEGNRSYLIRMMLREMDARSNQQKTDEESL